MAEIAVGIDLGTSNSCVAIARKRRVDVLPNAFGERTTASVVHIGANGSITVGNAAKANIIHDPTNTVYSAKRLIGRYFFSEEVKKAQAICSYKIVEGENHSVRIQVRDEAFSLPEIGAMVLREMKSIAESRLGEPVAKAVDHRARVLQRQPAPGDARRRRASPASRCCASSTSRPPPRSPTASARTCTSASPSTTSAAARSTSRCSRSARTSSRCSSTGGDTYLGGDDFDDRLIDLARRRLPRARGHQPAQRPVRAREAQGRGGEREEGPLGRGPRSRSTFPTSSRFRTAARARSSARSPATSSAALTSDLVQRTFKVCDEALQEAGIDRARPRRRDPGRRPDAAAR